jgi:hypothetical protein
MENNDESKEKKKKSKSFKSIEDILNIDGNSDNLDFNSEETEELQAKIDVARQEVNKMKEEFNKIKDLPDTEFSKTILKNLTERAMVMLAAIQTEIEDNPSGRAVETAAAMVSAINGIMDSYNKILINISKQQLAREQFEQKKLVLQNQSMNAGIGMAGGTTNILIGTNSDILDMLAAKGITPPGSYKKEVKETTADVIKTEENKV